MEPESAKYERGKSFSRQGAKDLQSPDHTYSNPEYVELPDGVVTVRGAYDHLPPLTPLVAATSMAPVEEIYYCSTGKITSYKSVSYWGALSGDLNFNYELFVNVLPPLKVLDDAANHTQTPAIYHVRINIISHIKLQPLVIQPLSPLYRYWKTTTWKGAELSCTAHPPTKRKDSTHR